MAMGYGPRAMARGGGTRILAEGWRDIPAEQNAADEMVELMPGFFAGGVNTSEWGANTLEYTLS